MLLSTPAMLPGFLRSLSGQASDARISGPDWQRLGLDWSADANESADSSKIGDTTYKASSGAIGEVASTTAGDVSSMLAVVGKAWQFKAAVQRRRRGFRAGLGNDKQLFFQTCRTCYAGWR